MWRIFFFFFFEREATRKQTRFEDCKHPIFPAWLQTGRARLCLPCSVAESFVSAQTARAPGELRASRWVVAQMESRLSPTESQWRGKHMCGIGESRKSEIQ